MHSPRNKQNPSPIESWVNLRFGGTDAKQAIVDRAENIVQTAGITAPPVDLAKLARAIGVDPWPIYEAGVEGALKVVEGRLRIILRKSKPMEPRGRTPIIGRTRFTYAHELAHTLFFDLEKSPPVRLAPKGCHKVEEQLCNKAAARFLMPEFLLRNALSNTSELSHGLLQRLADEFQTSIQAIAYRVAESFAYTLKPNQFFMLSANSSGFRGTSLEKPRCVICVLGPELAGQKISLLRSYQGINHIRRRAHGHRLAWSLEEYFSGGLHRKSGEQLQFEEVVESPCGSLLELNVCHTTVPRTALVWTQGTIRVIKTGNIYKK